MSRTIRRKNCDWKKYNYVDGWIDNPESLATLTGERKVYGYKLCGKYRGHTPEQIRAKLNAKWHGEVPRGWFADRRGVKEYSSWYIRRNQDRDLDRAIRNGEEDQMILTHTTKSVNRWFWSWD